MKSEFLKISILSFSIIAVLLTTFQLFSSTVCNLDNQVNEVNQNNMKIRLELFTSNIENTIIFYQDVLGFKPLNSSSNTYQPIQNGQVVLGIGLLDSLGNNHYFNSELSDLKFGYGVEIVLEVDNIQLTYNKVKKANIEIESELKKRPWGLKDFRLVDPNGYYIRITSKD